MKKEIRFAEWLLDNMDFYIPAKVSDKNGWLRVADQQFFTSEELVEIYKDETA